MNKQFSYLALGDSYTVGELVPLYESFPYQLVQMLRTSNVNFIAPEIIAQTGWTTDELLLYLSKTALLTQYDLVTLLIGVNNQYRGREPYLFKPDFELLIQKAIKWANGSSKNVVVLSIPDWSVTPFAHEKNILEIASAIDEYNKICRESSKAMGVHFIDITTQQREFGHEKEFLAGDGLHPSGKEYKRWANAIKRVVCNNMGLTAPH